MAMAVVAGAGELVDVTRVPPKTEKKGPAGAQNWARRTNSLYDVFVEGVDELHLAYAGEKTPTVVVTNLTAEALALKGDVRVSTYNDGEATTLPVEATLPAGGVVRLPIGRMLKKGVWRVLSDLHTATQKAQAETRFGVLRRREVTPPSAPGVFRMGIHYDDFNNSEADNAKCRAALVQAGAKLVRSDYYLHGAYGDVPQPDGTYDWRGPDARVAALEKVGIKLDMICYKTLPWMAQPAYTNHPKRWASPPKPGLYRELCRRYAERYGSRLAWFEVGNEWDLYKPDLMSIDEAIRVQKEAWEGVKAGCPDLKVIPNGWAVVHSDVIPHRTQRDMQERVMAEARDYYDAHPVHQHGPYREYRRRLREFFAWRQARGIDDKPWFPCETAQTTTGVGEDRVACCVWQKILFSWAHGAVDYVWYCLQARGFNASDGEQGYGLVTGDFYPRMTYAAFAGLTSCFDGATPVRVVHEGPNRDVYLFRAPDRLILVGWDLTTKTDVPVRVRTDAKRAWTADLFDNRTAAAVADGVATLTLSQTPQALVLDGATVAEPFAEDLVRGETREIATVSLGNGGRRFDLFDLDDVFEMYKADPEFFDRVWKGVGDLGGTIHIGRDGDRVRVTAQVFDERNAPGDRLVVLFDGVEKASVPPRDLTEKGAKYMTTVDVPPSATVWEIRVEDDDGHGKEGWITTGRFRLDDAAAAERRPRGLTCEYAESPAGVDVESPRLSWKLPAGFARQTAYELEVCGRSLGVVEGGRSVNVEPFAGRRFTDGQRVLWRVRVRDEKGAWSDWSETALFVCGKLSPWSAKWIAGDPATLRDYDFGDAVWVTAPTAAVFRTTFVLDAKPAVADFALISREKFDVRVNGLPTMMVTTGDWHDWRCLRRIDFAPWLKAGTNEISIAVRPFKGEKGVAAIATLVLPDGRRVGTDATWEGVAGTAGGLRAPAWGADVKAYHETLSPAFEKTFDVRPGLVCATLFVTGVGFYEAALNGRRVGEKLLDPAPTAYDRSVLYSTYVIDRRDLPAGENVLKLTLGHGWFDTRSVATWNWNMAPWRDSPRGIAELRLEYADGSVETVGTDASWRMAPTRTLYDCIREGEVTGAAKPVGDGLRAQEARGPAGRLVGELLAPTKVCETMAPEKIRRLADGSWLVTFPKNISGWVRLRLKENAPGDVVSIRYDERIVSETQPEVDTWHLGVRRQPGETPVPGAVTRRVDVHFRNTASHHVVAQDAAFQCDRIVADGGVKVYEPRFTYDGFRYVWIRGYKGDLTAADVAARFVHNDFRRTGSFVSSDAMLNELVDMAILSYEGNFANGYPTDCPQREKNGWTCDGQVVANFAQFCFENTAAYEKWTRDLLDAQRPDGSLSGIAPTPGWGYSSHGYGPGWDSALSVVPRELLVYREDERIARAAYPGLLRLVRLTAGLADADNLDDHGLGDWCAVDKAHMPTRKFTSSCWYADMQETCARFAALAGDAAVADEMRQGAAKTRAALHRLFYKGEGVYDNGGQTAQAMALRFGVVPEAEVAAARAALVRSVERTGGHNDFGVFGSMCVFRMLSEAGRTDLAFKMLVNPEAPSYAAWAKEGGGTLWENYKGSASLNHVFFGDYVAWAYKYLAGIDADAADGWRRMVFAPRPIAALDFARAETETPYGTVRGGWRREGGRVRYELRVPPQCEARVRLPGEAERVVGPGDHVFESAR